jgi:hypothetical protein
MHDFVGSTLSVSYRPLVVFVLLAVVLAAFFYTVFRSRRHVAESDQRLCSSCATPHPLRAQFCRKCGKRLS